MTGPFTFPDHPISVIEEVRIACSQIIGLFDTDRFEKINDMPFKTWSSDPVIDHGAADGVPSLYNVSHDGNLMVFSLMRTDEKESAKGPLISVMMKHARYKPASDFPRHLVESIHDRLDARSCADRQLMHDTVSTIVALAGIESVRNTMTLLDDGAISLVAKEASGSAVSHLFMPDQEDPPFVHRLVHEHFHLGGLEICDGTSESRRSLRMNPYHRPIPLGPIQVMKHIATLGPDADLRVPEFIRH